MLYSWTGKPYASKHDNLAAVLVTGVWKIKISHSDGGEIRYEHGMESSTPLHELEGFASREEMDDWFRGVVPIGMIHQKFLIRFRLGREADLAGDSNAQRVAPPTADTENL